MSTAAEWKALNFELRTRNSFSSRSAFTLIEIMLAVAIMGLVLTAVTIGVRSKWKTEVARRGAQQIVNTLLRARSYAWREGVEWVVVWDSKAFLLDAKPLEDFETEQEGGSHPLTDEPSKAFQTELGSKIQLSPDSEKELPVFHFLPNGRVQPASVLVRGPENDMWRVQVEWTGIPTMELLKSASDKETKKKQRIPTIEK